MLLGYIPAVRPAEILTGQLILLGIRPGGSFLRELGHRAPLSAPATSQEGCRSTNFCVRNLPGDSTENPAVPDLRSWQSLCIIRAMISDPTYPPAAEYVCTVLSLCDADV